MKWMAEARKAKNLRVTMTRNVMQVQVYLQSTMYLQWTYRCTYSPSSIATMVAIVAEDLLTDHSSKPAQWVERCFWPFSLPTAIVPFQTLLKLLSFYDSDKKRSEHNYTQYVRLLKPSRSPLLPVRLYPKQHSLATPNLSLTHLSTRWLVAWKALSEVNWRESLLWVLVVEAWL